MNLKISGKKAAPPKFTEQAYNILVSEAVEVSKTIGRVTATRPNKVWYREQLIYDIVDGNHGEAFSIDPRAGSIEVSRFFCQ